MGLLSDFVEEAPDIVDDDDKDGFLKRTFKNAPETFATYFVAGAAQQAGKGIGKQVSDGVKGFLNLPQQARLRKANTFIRSNQDVRNMQKAFDRLNNNPMELAIQKHLRDGKSEREAIYLANEPQVKDIYINKIRNDAISQGKTFDIAKFKDERLRNGARQFAFFTNNGKTPSLIDGLMQHRQNYLNELSDLGGIPEIKKDENLLEALVKMHGGSQSNSFINGVKAYPKSLLNLFGKGMTPEDEAQGAINTLKNHPLIKKELVEALEAQREYASPEYITNAALKHIKDLDGLAHAKSLSTTLDKKTEFKTVGSGKNLKMIKQVTTEYSDPSGKITTGERPEVIPMFTFDENSADQYATSLQEDSSSNALTIVNKITNQRGLNEILKQVEQGINITDPKKRSFFIDKGTGDAIRPDSLTLTLAQRRWFISTAYNLAASDYNQFTTEGWQRTADFRNIVKSQMIKESEIGDDLAVFSSFVPRLESSTGINVELKDFLNEKGTDVKEGLIVNGKVNENAAKLLSKKYTSEMGFPVGSVTDYIVDLASHFQTKRTLTRSIAADLEGLENIVEQLNLYDNVSFEAPKLKELTERLKLLKVDS
jgi:hypothetical protein